MTEKKLSRQRLWQLRQKEKGLCQSCAAPVWREGAKLCERHMIAERERARERSGTKKRNRAASYQIDKKKPLKRKK